MRRVTVIVGAGCGTAATLPSLADRAALEFAVDRFGVEPDVFCLSADQAAERYARAAGAASVQVLSDLDAVQGDWVLVGPGASGVCGDWLPAMIAERLEAALVFDVCEVISVTAVSLVVKREAGFGERDELGIRPPAVLVLSPQTAPRRYVSRYRQRVISTPATAAAAALADPLYSFGSAWEPVRPRALATAAPTGQAADERTNSAFGMTPRMAERDRAGEPISADPETCAMHLLRYLLHHQLLPGDRKLFLPEISAAPTTAVAPPDASPAVAGAESIQTRAPRRSGELPGAAHRRQPRRVAKQA